MKLIRQEEFLSNKKVVWKVIPFNQLETNSKGSAF